MRLHTQDSFNRQILTGVGQFGERVPRDLLGGPLGIHLSSWRIRPKSSHATTTSLCGTEFLMVWTNWQISQKCLEPRLPPVRKAIEVYGDLIFMHCPRGLGNLLPTGLTYLVIKRLLARRFVHVSIIQNPFSTFVLFSSLVFVWCGLSFIDACTESKAQLNEKD